MEAILARALEYTLKYWLKSFSRDQLKLQGRSVQLSNLDINGEALHASMGLPPALSVTKARVRKFEIILPYVSNVQVDPIVIQIDKLDLVLEENGNFDASNYSNASQSSNSSKSGSYGFADKIADGMTIKVSTVNLLVETRGSGRKEGGAAWAPPLASITIRNLLLYTTNEKWQVVNLKEARDFSSNKKFIYVFRKLEWESLSIDLLPHPDMFAELSSSRFEEGGAQRESDGAKRVFFGGERFLEGICGEANITVKRTELNSPLGLEVQIHVTEAVCPALSEPGLRAVLRFMTGFHVCLNRGIVDEKPQKLAEAAGISLVSILVDHIFLCISDPEFRLELLMQSLLFSRASVSDGRTMKNLTSLNIGGILLRDTFSRPPCVLVQPSTHPGDDSIKLPEFAQDFCPQIYPCQDQEFMSPRIPLMCLFSLQVSPTPKPPFFSSETVINCQPIMFHLQEDSCLRISSFLVDGLMVANNAESSPENSINSLKIILSDIDVAIPLDVAHLKSSSGSDTFSKFNEARIHLTSISYSESPLLKLRRLNLEKDPACYLLWLGQPVDSSQKKWKVKTSHLVVSLEAGETPSSGSMKCLEFKDANIEIAMVSGDGSPLTILPPPQGIVRVGFSCQQLLSNTSVEQLFFVLDLYTYVGIVWDKISSVLPKNRDTTNITLLDRVPCDTVVSLALNSMQLKFLESSLHESVPLVQFTTDDILIKISHRMLGGAVAISSTVRWQSVEVSCVETQRENNNVLLPQNGFNLLRPVFWIHKQSLPFLDINLVHVVPLKKIDRECHDLSVSLCACGVRLGGGMNYAESLLHRFGVFGPDGGPSLKLTKGIKNLSKGPFSHFFKTSQLTREGEILKENNDTETLNLGIPDEVDVRIEFKDWLFALEDADHIRLNSYNENEEIFWHAMFKNLLIKCNDEAKQKLSKKTFSTPKKSPFDSLKVAVEGLQILKPREQISCSSLKEPIQGTDGINFESLLALTDDNGVSQWIMESVKVSTKNPIEAVVTKEELRQLTSLCKSEIDATGRIAAGILKLLKLENSIGHSTINHLSNLGTESFNKIFTANADEDSNAVIDSMEDAIIESQVKCDSLISTLGNSEDALIIARNLENLKHLVMQLRHNP